MRTIDSPIVREHFATLFGIDPTQLRGRASFECNVAIHAMKTDRRTTYLVDGIRGMRIGRTYLGDVRDSSAHLFLDGAIVEVLEQVVEAQEEEEVGLDLARSERRRT